MRIQVRPASDTQAFLERMAQLCREGKVTRSGYPRPLAGAEVVRDFGHTGHASAPPLRAQRAIARLILGVANVSRPYMFVDEWDVATPPEPVFDAIADAGSYPTWWRPVYIDVEADGPPAVGVASRQHFKGRLPYHLRTTSVITEMDAPRTITAEVDGDLRGRGTWTLTPRGERTHVRFDWQVHADRRLLRVLTPVLRPLFRWNHNWAIARAMEGLEPYAGRPPCRLRSWNTRRPSEARRFHLSESGGPQNAVNESEPAKQTEKVPLTARLMLHESLSARRAAAIIAATTVVITVAGGILERVFDHKDFHTTGKGLWFALETVTTVGYGDVTPSARSGRIIAGVIMLAGIAFLAIITAAVTAALIESSRRRFVQTEADMSHRLEEVSERLSRIESALERVGSGPGEHGAS